MTTARRPIGVFNNFSGGQNSANPPDTLDVIEAEVSKNLVVLPRGRGIRSMNGDTEFNSTAMNGGATVTGLLYYKQADADDFLLATAGNKIFKSDALDGTMDDISAALTVTAGDNNTWTSFVAEDEAVFVGGAPDVPFKWTGSGNAVVLGGSPPSGDFGFYHNNRAFIGRASLSRIDWSVLEDIEDWSGDGSGFQRAQTADGDTLLNGVVISTDIVLLFKQNSIHQLITHSHPFPLFELFPGSRTGAAGKHAIVKGPDDLIYFITPKGRMKITDGTRLMGEETFPRLKSIDDVWDGLNSARLNRIRGASYRGIDFNWIIWTAPNGTATQNDHGIYWDIDNKCWGELPDGFNTNIFTLTQDGLLFGGHFDGKIYKKDVAVTTTNASESGASIESIWRSGWNHYGNIQALKYQEELLVGAKTETTGKMNVSIGKDYTRDVVNKDVSLVGPGGKWGVGLWGVMKWGGRKNFIAEPILTNIRGRVLQHKFDNIGQANAFTLNQYSPVGKVSD